MKSFKRIKGILAFLLVFALVSPVVLPVFNLDTIVVSAKTKESVSKAAKETVSKVAKETVSKGKSILKLNKTKLKLKVGKTYTLKLISNKKNVLWSSSNTAIATVSKVGKVKGVKEGTATITAVYKKKKYTCKVTVTNVVTGSAISATGSAIIKKPKAKKKK